MATPDQPGVEQVTVVVVTFRGREFIGECLASLAAQSLPHRVVVIDNASEDGTSERLAADFPDTVVHRCTVNTGFAGGLAAGLALVETAWCALLNDDAVADPGWLAALVAAADATDIAAVTSQMLLASSPADAPLINNLGVGLTADGYGYDLGLGRPADAGFDEPTEVFGFSGGAALLRLEAVRRVGGSPTHFFLYYEDTDISWRLRLAGYRVVSTPEAVVHHRHSATVGQHGPVFHAYNERNRLLMLLRCAPLRSALWQLLRFAVTTSSVTVRETLRRARRPELNLQAGFRWRIFGRVVVSLPRTFAERQRIGRFANVSRRDVAIAWVGVDPLSPP